MTVSHSDQDSIFPLTQFALIEINGPDSEKFLQGQLTCDIHQVKDQTWVLGACCTAKGRMVANFLIGRIDDQFYLRVCASVADILINHLKKYAVFFKTQLQLSDLKVYGLLSSTQVEISEQASPTDARQVHSGRISKDSESASLHIHWPDHRQEYWFDPRAESSTQYTLLTDSSSLIKPWLQADINAGLFWLDAQQTDQWIPQQIAWDQLGGVSFSKGCYTGQEIVARLQYLGKSKKIIALVTLTEPQDAELIDPPMVTNGHSEGRSVATLLTWVATQGLVISSYSETTQVTLVSEQGQAYSADLIPFLAAVTDDTDD